MCFNNSDCAKRYCCNAFIYKCRQSSPCYPFDGKKTGALAADKIINVLQNAAILTTTNAQMSTADLKVRAMQL